MPVRSEPSAHPVTLPTGVLPALAEACAAAGAPAVAALRAAGRRLGEAAWEEIAAGVEEGLGGDGFRERGSAWLRRAGLGEAAWGRAGTGLGKVTVANGAEAGAPPGEGPAPRGRGGCALTAGLLEGLLSRAAGRPVAAVERACRAHGAPACTFLFGSPARVALLPGDVEPGRPPAPPGRA